MDKIYDEITNDEINYDEAMDLVDSGKAALSTIEISLDDPVDLGSVGPHEYQSKTETRTILHKFSEDEINFEKNRRDEFERQALIPTNTDLSDSAVELAQGVSDNEDALVELGDYAASLEDMIKELKTKVSALEGNNG